MFCNSLLYSLTSVISLFNLHWQAGILTKVAWVKKVLPTNRNLRLAFPAGNLNEPLHFWQFSQNLRKHLYLTFENSCYYCLFMAGNLNCSFAQLIQSTDSGLEVDKKILENRCFILIFYIIVQNLRILREMARSTKN